LECGMTILRVYELRGERLPPGVPEEGLAGIWPEPPYFYLFYTAEALDSILEWVKSNPQWQLTSSYTLPYEQWQDVSGAQFTIGPFTILAARGSEDSLGPPPRIPSGILSGISPGIPIRIDPGIVFGSGLHPTTRGCILALAALFQANEIHKAVDLGTGTGILAIACILLGTRRVIAIDCNMAALCVARRNAQLNGAADKISFLAADRPAVLKAASDLLVMNLEWPILQKILETDEWKGYPFIIASGFLESLLDHLKATVRPWFHVAETIVLDGWPIVTLARRQAGEVAARS